MKLRLFRILAVFLCGIGGNESNHHTTGWKLWGVNSNVEIIDNVLDTQPDVWDANGSRQMWIVAAQCTQDWTIRNNEFIDSLANIVTQGAGTPFCTTRSVDNILVDRNIMINTWPRWMGQGSAVTIGNGPDADGTVANMTITNNFIYNHNPSDPNAGFYNAISCSASVDSGTQPGTVTIVGNTIYGLRPESEWGGSCAGIRINPARTYGQNNFVIKNNIINKMHGTEDNYNIYVNHAPTSFVANGNLYDANGAWRWDGNKYLTLGDWQSASGEDANSSTGVPLFVDAANGDLHLDPNDTVAQGKGVDISGITDHDYDGDTRDSSTKTAGADVP